MNILILNYRDSKHPQAGGAEVHLQRIFSRIASWGHRVLLVTTQFPGATERDSIEGIEVLRMGGDHLFQFHVLAKYRSICKEFNPDVVVEDLNKLPFYTPLLDKRPKFIQIHHLWRYSIFQEASFPVAFLVWFQENLIPWFYKKEQFAAVSPSTVSELEEMGIPSRNIHLIYNGSENDWGQIEHAHQKGRYFLWLGRLRRYKGVWVALEAFKKFSAKVPDVKLVIAGGGPEEQPMRRAIAEWGLQERVEILGFIPMEEKRNLLRGALCLIQSSFKEGWGLTIIEAGICGTMSIASRVPGLKDSVIEGHTGLLVEAGNPGALANSMIQVIQDPDGRQNMERAARVHAQSFSWEKAAKQTFEVLLQCVSRKG